MNLQPTTYQLTAPFKDLNGYFGLRTEHSPFTKRESWDVSFANNKRIGEQMIARHADPRFGGMAGALQVFINLYEGGNDDA